MYFLSFRMQLYITAKSNCHDQPPEIGGGQYNPTHETWDVFWKEDFAHLTGERSELSFPEGTSKGGFQRGQGTIVGYPA